MNENALKERIKQIAKSEGRTFTQVWKDLVLERLLTRVSKSKYHDNLVFKGGLLLSYYIDLGRETKDIDFLVQEITAKQEKIEGVFKGICKVKIKDGFDFELAGTELLEQDHMNYPGYRHKLEVKFGGMKDRIQIDVGIGDIVSPKEESFELYQFKGKPIFEGTVSLKVYPLETVFAEKLETVVAKGAANSRMKDFHDLLMLAREPKILKIKKLRADILNTFSNRNTGLDVPLTFSDEELKKLQQLWIAHIKGLGQIANELELPAKISLLIEEVNNWLVLNKVKGRTDGQ